MFFRRRLGAQLKRAAEGKPPAKPPAQSLVGIPATSNAGPEPKGSRKRKATRLLDVGVADLQKPRSRPREAGASRELIAEHSAPGKGLLVRATPAPLVRATPTRAALRAQGSSPGSGQATMERRGHRRRIVVQTPR